MNARTALTMTLFALLLITLPAIGEDNTIGSINTLKGNATILRDGVALPAKLGDPLLARDVLKTDKDSAMGIVLRDNTTVSLGALSTLGMKEFEFKPSEGLFSMVMNMAKGTFVYISGTMGKLSPESVKVETPVGVVAVRGTKFMAKIK